MSACVSAQKFHSSEGWYLQICLEIRLVGRRISPIANLKHDVCSLECVRHLQILWTSLSDTIEEDKGRQRAYHDRIACIISCSCSPHSKRPFELLKGGSAREPASSTKRVIKWSRTRLSQWDMRSSALIKDTHVVKSGSQFGTELRQEGQWRKNKIAPRIRPHHPILWIEQGETRNRECFGMSDWFYFR